MDQLGRNILSAYAVRFAALAAGVFHFPFVTGHVGLTAYGVWLLVNSLNIFLATDFGMGPTTTRFVAQAHARRDATTLNQIASTSLAFFLAVGTLSALTYGLGMFLLRDSLNIPASYERTATIMIVTTTIATFQIGIPLSAFRNILAGLQRYDIVNAILIGQVIVRLVLIVIFIRADYGILAVAGIEAVVSVGGELAMMAACFRLMPQMRLSRRLIDVQLMKSMLPYSLQIFTTTMLGYLILQTDNFIIGLFLPVAMVTLYAGAFRLYQSCRELIGALSGPLIPEAARSSALERREHLINLLLRGTKFANGFTLLVAVPAIVFAEPVLVAWAGPDFAPMGRVAQVLLVGLIASNNHLVSVALLTGMGRVRAFLAFQVLWAGANIVLSVLLIQRYGLIGMAIGTALPVVLLEPLYLRMAAREFGVRPRPLASAGLRPLVLAAVAAVPILLLARADRAVGLGLVLAGSGVFAATYTALFALFALDRQERRVLWNALPLIQRRAPSEETPSPPKSADRVRVFVPCAFTWENKGDAALLFALVQSLRREFGEVDLTFTSFTPAADARRYGLPFLAMPLRPDSLVSGHLHKWPRALGRPNLAPYLVTVQLATFLAAIRLWAGLRRRVGRGALALLPPRVRAVARAIEGADVVVAMPGGYLIAPEFTQDYWMYHAATLGMAQALGKRLVLAPCSIGPFPGIHRTVARRLLCRCDLVMVREAVSVGHIHALGVPPDRVHPVPDLAFAFADDGRAAAELAPVLERLADLPRPWVGISVRSHRFPGAPDPDAAFAAYLDAVAATVDHLTAGFGVGAVFVPQCIGAGGDDVAVARQVWARLRAPERAVVLDDDLSPHALQRLYGALEVVIGTRMHANIMAMNAGTPVVAVAYEHKTTGIMAGLGLARYALPIAEAEARLLAVTLDLWTHRDRVRAGLPARVEEARAATGAAARHVRTVLEGDGRTAPSPDPVPRAAGAEVATR